MNPRKSKKTPQTQFSSSIQVSFLKMELMEPKNPGWTW
jgi:hypothetical protein